MNLEFNIVINSYSIFLMVIIYHQLRRLASKETLQYRLNIMMLQITGLLLVLDIFSRFDGNPGTLFPIVNYVGNFLIFLLSPVLPSIWLVYVCWQVCHDSSKLKLLRFPLIAIFVVNAGMTILSLFHGWYYTIDSGNIYHRGPLQVNQ